MQLPDAVSAIARRGERQRHRRGEEPGYFVYHGREGEYVPDDVTHVKIHSSVRAIKPQAFMRRRELRIFILNEELEEIGYEAFGHDIAHR